MGEFFITSWAKIQELVYSLVSWLQRTRRRRFIAALVILFTVATSIIGWTGSIYTAVHATLKFVGLDNESNKERRVLFYRSYVMGKNLGDYVFLQEQIREGVKSQMVAEKRTAAASMFGATASLLSLPIDVANLSTTPLSNRHYSGSDGYRFIRAQIGTIKGEDAALAFETGFQHSIFDWRIAIHDYDPFKDYPAFPQTIEIAFRQAARIGFPSYKEVRMKSVEKQADSDENDHKLKMSLFEYDREIQNKFGR
jgi:hypothetical protein